VERGKTIKQPPKTKDTQQWSGAEGRPEHNKSGRRRLRSDDWFRV